MIANRQVSTIDQLTSLLYQLHVTVWASTNRKFNAHIYQDYNKTKMTKIGIKSNHNKHEIHVLKQTKNK